MADNSLAGYVLLLALFAALFLMGCTTDQDAQTGPQAEFRQKGQQAGNPDGQRPPGRGGNFSNGEDFPRNGNGSFGNLTEEQRKLMMEQRQQALIGACKGKAQEDSCTIADQRGSREGTCKIAEGQLICNLPMPSNIPGRTPPN